ncbi:MAG: hypothetical protein ABIF88_00300 [archaeon]
MVDEKKTGEKENNNVKKLENFKKSDDEVKKIEEKIAKGENVEIEEKIENKAENSDGKKSEEKKKFDRKGTKKKIIVKDVAVANGFSLRISPKFSINVCRTIVGKSPDAAIARLEDVIKEKRVIPMAGLEVGHKHGKGLAGGRYPKNVCKAIIGVIKQVKANAVVNGIENPIIIIAKPNKASAPLRRGRTQAKRTHIYLEVKDKEYLIKKGLFKLKPKRRNKLKKFVK